MAGWAGLSADWRPTGSRFHTICPSWSQHIRELAARDIVHTRSQTEIPDDGLHSPTLEGDHLKLTLLLVYATSFCCTAADRILLTRIGPSQAALYASNPDGSGERALTQGTLDYNPAWSADGKWIVFTSEREGSADLYRMRPDGTGVERLTDDPAYDDQAHSHRMATRSSS